MEAGKQECSYVQCRNCGNIYKVERQLPIDALIVEMYCHKCDNETALNLGSDESDLYIYADINVDPRYYEY